MSILAILLKTPFILDLADELDEDVNLTVFPELCITGYTCQDLFYEDILLNNSIEALKYILKHMKDNLLMVVSLPLAIDNKLYNCAAACFNHEVLGIQAKTYIPTYNEFYESRWFLSGKGLNKTVRINDRDVLVSNNLIFHDLTTGAMIGIEICEDLWVADSISTHLCLAGANIICNPSASNEIIAKKEYREDLIRMQSARNYCAYIYASAGTLESTSNLLFSGHDIISENGTVLSSRYMNDTDRIIVAEIDLEHLKNDRLRYKTAMETEYQANIITFKSKPYEYINLTRNINPYPFVLKDNESRVRRSLEIMNIQANALATRLKKQVSGMSLLGSVVV